MLGVGLWIDLAVLLEFGPIRRPDCRVRGFGGAPEHSKCVKTRPAEVEELRNGGPLGAGTDA